MEPRASAPARRLEAVRDLAAAGIPVNVMLAPVVPGLTDHEIPAILQTAADAGAMTAGYVPLRLPFGVAELFEQWLEAHRPQRKQKVLNRIRSMRDGRLNDPNFRVADARIGRVRGADQSDVQPGAAQGGSGSEAPGTVYGTLPPAGGSLAGPLRLKLGDKVQRTHGGGMNPGMNSALLWSLPGASDTCRLEAITSIVMAGGGSFEDHRVRRFINDLCVAAAGGWIPYAGGGGRGAGGRRACGGCRAPGIGHSRKGHRRSSDLPKVRVRSLWAAAGKQAVLRMRGRMLRFRGRRMSATACGEGD